MAACLVNMKSINFTEITGKQQEKTRSPILKKIFKIHLKESFVLFFFFLIGVEYSDSLLVLYTSTYY